MNQAQTIALYQPMLHAIAYRMVRCKEDAEDIVQETFMKWLNSNQQKIDNTKAYLIRAVTNNCLNHLENLKRKKTEYLDSLHLPDLKGFIREMNFSHLDLDVNLSAAMTVLHEKLEPLERSVYVLKEVFELDYAAIQKALDKKQDHCRQLFSRARKKLADSTPSFHVEMPDTAALVQRFREACERGHVQQLIAELQHDWQQRKKKI